MGEWRKAAAGRAEGLRQCGLEEEEEAEGAQRRAERIKRRQHPLQHGRRCGRQLEHGAGGWLWVRQ